MAHRFSIIYGTAWKKERTSSLVRSAILAGFRAVDTACQLKHYREDLVGDALQQIFETSNIKREDIFIQTKFTSISGQDRQQPIPYDPSSTVAQQVKSSFSTSLRNLKTTYIVSYILHSPLDTMELTLEAWRVLCELQDKGVVKKIGVSNTYDVRILEMLEKTGGRGAQIVQNRWYEGNGFDKEVVNYCKERDIQYQSFWTLTGSPGLLGSPDVTSLCEQKRVTPAQMLYRLVQYWGIVPLAGSTNEEHMQDGVEAEQIQLAAEEIPRGLSSMVWGTRVH
ncbi:hypothetical protein FRC14_003376 [Serendipita sp. 396]|nr:hypothetical protein FRC14_003376 [Serendipita sp. 396]KAG8784341.1 hypothetical protein FRC15_003415 [Serendipita sp. 397]